MTLIFETDSYDSFTGFKIVTERGKNRFGEYVADICINLPLHYFNNFSFEFFRGPAY